MSGATDAVLPPRLLRARYILAILLALGLVSLAAVSDRTEHPDECGPFSIGQSAIGGCDRIGG
jgi:hypothetical protein